MRKDKNNARDGARETATVQKRKKRFGDIFDTGYLRSVIIGAAGSVILLGLVYYVCWHITGGFKGGVELVTAVNSSAEERLETVGYMFRDETVLYSDYGGAVNYAFADGERAAAGDMLLTTYRDPGSASITEALKSIDKRIEILKESAVEGKVSVSYTKALENSIDVALRAMGKSLAEGRYGSAVSQSEDLLVLLNKKDLIFSSSETYGSVLAALEAERASLASGLTGESKRMYAPYAGYFYSYCDGNEGLYTVNALNELTPSALDDLKNAADNAGGSGSTAVGKIARSRKWYLVVETEKSSLKDHSVGKLAEVVFSDCGDVALKMLLERTVEEGERALLVYSSEELPEGMDMMRRFNISIKIREYSGLRVPVSAIRYVDGREGVYCLFGNTVLFRVIDVVGTVDGYAYVSENCDPVMTTVEEVNKDGERVQREVVLYGALGLYDRIITAGTGMYHGLIID